MQALPRCRIPVRSVAAPSLRHLFPSAMSLAEKDYLAQHAIPELLNRLILQLVEAQPADPKTFLANAVLDIADSDPGYPDLGSPAHPNMMARVLTPALYKKLSKRRTSSGFTLDQVIQWGVDVPGQEDVPGCVGVVAGDEDCYQVYGELLQPIIAQCHPAFAAAGQHTSRMDHLALRGAALDDAYVVGLRLRACRNVRGFPLPPQCNRQQRRDVEKLLCGSCQELVGHLGGEYSAARDLSARDRQRLVAQGVFCPKPETPMHASGRMVRDWPDGRGTYFNPNCSFMVWLNVDDHAKIICAAKGSNMRDVFEHYIDAVQALEAAVNKAGYNFMFSDDLGYITTSPSNLGTGMKCSVFIQLPAMCDHDQLPALLEQLQLKSRPVAEHARANLSAWTPQTREVYNEGKLGVSENDLVQRVCRAADTLVACEKALAANDSIQPIIDALQSRGEDSGA